MDDLPPGPAGAAASTDHQEDQGHARDSGGEAEERGENAQDDFCQEGVRGAKAKSGFGFGGGRTISSCSGRGWRGRSRRESLKILLAEAKLTSGDVIEIAQNLKHERKTKNQNQTFNLEKEKEKENFQKSKIKPLIVKE